MPLTVDRKVMASVMKTHRFEGIRYEFVPGGEIVPYLAPHESRRLFGGAEGPVHTHTGDRYVASTRDRARLRAPPVRATLVDRTIERTGPSGSVPTLARHAAVRRLDVPDRRLRVLQRARVGDPDRVSCTDAATLRAFARTAVEQAARGDGIALARARIARRAPATSTKSCAIDRAVFARKLIERDADDVGAHGPEVRRDGRAA